MRRKKNSPNLSFTLGSFVPNFWSFKSRKVSSNGQYPCMSSKLKKRVWVTKSIFRISMSCHERVTVSICWTLKSWKWVRKTHCRKKIYWAWTSIENRMSPKKCRNGLPLYICLRLWGGVMVTTLRVSSIYMITHLSGIWSLLMVILILTAMNFFPQPCEQGHRGKRIHAVANIGTALKFLEGRKVRNKMEMLERKLGSSDFNTVVHGAKTVCCLYYIGMQQWCKII